MMRHGLTVFAAAALIHPAAAAEPPARELFPGVTFRAETRHSPPQRLFIAEVDLTRKDLRLEVARGGPDPDGPGPWETTLLEPTRIAAREGFELVANGDFFRARPPNGEKWSGYHAGMWGDATGPAVSEGRPWSSSNEAAPCLVVRHDGSVRIAALTAPGPDVRAAIAGHPLLVRRGEVVAKQDPARHPRTVVGLDHQGGRKLVILVVDGRRAKVAAGMTYAELAAEMLRLGCQEALNLDGGGSSVLAARDPASGKLAILNAPTDGRERPVANALGIRRTAR